MAAQAPTLPIEVDPLIAEAKERARRRRLLALGLTLAVAASIATPLATRSSRKAPAVTGTSACGIATAGTQILQHGQSVYRLPSQWTNAGNVPSQVKCSGSTVWVVWVGGVAAGSEAYAGVRSGDGGHTWRLVSGGIGVNAPHSLGAYSGPWTLRGNAAYFAGSCPACSVGNRFSTVSLYVTKDGGRTFQVYPVPALAGFAPGRIRVSGDSVTIVGNRMVRGVAPHKTATVQVP